MNSNINFLVEKLKEIQILESYLDGQKQLKKKYLIELEELQIELNIYNSEINRLSKKSIISIYHALLGNLDSNLDVARQHFLSLSINFNDVNKSLENLEEKIALTQIQISSKEELKKELKSQLKEVKYRLKNPKLKKLKIKTLEIEKQVIILKELVEAIEQGRILNLKLNKGINYLKSKAIDHYQKTSNSHSLLKLNIRNLNKYQNIIIEIKHSLLHFQIELNDVFQAILMNKTYSSEILKNYIDEFRSSLSIDFIHNENMNNSYMFLQKFKMKIKTLVKSLRSDRKTIQKRIDKLISEQNELFERI